MKGYHKNCEFPNELYIQSIIEKYFEQLGFQQCEKEYVDLIVRHPNGERWVIESKGHSAAIRTDFCTCLGQILCQVQDSITKYAIALPQTPQYIRQLRYLSQYMRCQLNLHIILVNISGNVIIINPEENFSNIIGLCRN